MTPAHLPADLAAVDKLPAPPPIPVGAHATSRRVLILGAGGPLGAAAATALAPDHQLRLTDVRPLAEIVAQGTPQSPGAPLPKLWPPPHEHLTVDVTDAGQTAAAMDGIDIVVNCTVVRPDPIAAFLVNTIGAYNVARAAVDRGLRRIVHTGPEQALLAHPAGYAADVDLSEDIPPRPGDNLYFVSKFLGQEICRIFAAEHALEIPALFYSTLVEPDVSPRAPFGIHPLAISWRDAGEAIRAAVTVGSLPRPYEPFHIGVDLPHGQYRVAKASALLHWQPRDRLERHWQRAGE
ncbi:MAG: NAD-dependent epimerase/dehydratase family protein [Dehalococcoidia bacterium]